MDKYRTFYIWFLLWFSNKKKTDLNWWNISGLHESWIKVIGQYLSIAIPIAKKKVPVIAKVRERIIRSEHISHFHVISFEEDQLNSSDETLKIFVFFLNFNALHLVKSQAHLNKPTAMAVDILNKVCITRH